MKSKRAVKTHDTGLRRHTDNFYDIECIHDSVDDDLISDAEGGFMMGYIGH
jgi:hypothetical protein